MALGKKCAQACHVLGSLNQMMLKSGCLSGAWLVPSDFGFDCKQYQSSAF